MPTRAVLAGLIAVALLSSCAVPDSGDSSATTTALPPEPEPEPKPGVVSRGEYGDQWPLTVDQGRLECEPPSRAIFVDPDGNKWALNGMAIMGGYPRIDPIWADDPDAGDPALKKNMILLDDALELC